ncbi:MAG: nucleotidyltransferase family protein [Legionellaceae bacterium]
MNTAMILAAGRGERLRPLTDRIPKALCLINGIPLIQYHVEHLAHANYQRVVINHAHLGGQIKTCLGDGSRFGLEIIYIPEPPGALETGGGLVNALPYLGDTPFLTINADIFTDYPFEQFHNPDTSKIHTVLIKTPHSHPYADFGVSEHNELLNTDRRYTLAGITSYPPSLLRTCPQGRYSITPFLRQWADQRLITAEIYEGTWYDTGTPSRLEEARQHQS